MAAVCVRCSCLQMVGFQTTAWARREWASESTIELHALFWKRFLEMVLGTEGPCCSEGIDKYSFV